MRRLAFVAMAFAALAAAAWAPSPSPAGHESLASLPAVPVPAHNPMSEEKIALGRLLFFDARLSGDASTSCASCHLPQHGWSHSEALAPGYPGHRLWRNNPTVLNAAYFRHLMQLFDSNPRVQIAVRWQNRQRDVPRAVYRDRDEDLGRYYRTRDAADIGKFRTPSLRELKYTAPYMHNGVFATLREVVDFFDAGGGATANKSPLLKPLGLTGEEKNDLVAFLEALSMERPLLVAVPELPPILPLDGVVGSDCAAPDAATKGSL